MQFGLSTQNWVDKVNWPLQRDSKAEVLSVSPLSERIQQRDKARNVSFRIPLWRPIHIVHPVDKTKLSCNTPTNPAPQLALETYPLFPFTMDTHPYCLRKEMSRKFYTVFVFMSTNLLHCSFYLCLVMDERLNS